MQHAESQRRHGEEIHRSNSFPMIAQEGRPTLCRLRIPRRSAQHSTLGNIESKYLQLTMNTRSTPGWVLGHYAEGELAHFECDSLPATTGAMLRKPRPIRFESGTVPSDNGLRLDENQRLLPPTPKTSQHHPEQSVRGRKVRLRMFLLQDGKLLPKRQILQQWIATRTTESNRQRWDSPQQTQYKPNFT